MVAAAILGNGTLQFTASTRDSVPKAQKLLKSFGRTFQSSFESESLETSKPTSSDALPQKATPLSHLNGVSK